MKRNQLIIGLMLFSGISFSQKKTFSDIRKFRIRNTGAIVQSGEVTGSYIFYQKDKVDKKNNLYVIEFLGPNLESVGTKEIVASKFENLTQAAYDGTSLCLRFFNPREKTISYQLYDNKASLVKELKSGELNKYALMTENAALNQNLETFSNFSELGQAGGFVGYEATKPKKTGFDVQYFDAKSGKKWKYSSPASESMHLYPSYLCSTDKIVYTLVAKKKSAMTRDIDYHVYANRLSDGKYMFDLPPKDNKYQYMYYSAFNHPGTDHTTFLGMYFNLGDKLLKAKSQGLVMHTINSKGEDVEKKHVSWARDISKLLTADQRLKIKDAGNMYFHHIFRSPQGKIYAVAEQYKKVFAAGASALSMLGSGSGANAHPSAKLVIEDLFVYEFSKNFELEGVKVFDKEKSNQNMGPGSLYYSSQILGKLAKGYGFFDYAYTQQNKVKDNFTVCYMDYNKDEGKKRKTMKFYAATKQAESDFVTDKISLETDATSLRTLRAKPGHVVILEYFKKEKKLEMRLEKFNY